MIKKELLNTISTAFKSLFDYTIAADELSLQPTRKEFDGTYTFVVFPFLKHTKKNPEESGKALGEFVKNSSALVRGYNVVKGFLNFEIEDETWLHLLMDMYAALDYGRADSNGQLLPLIPHHPPSSRKWLVSN